MGLHSGNEALPPTMSVAGHEVTRRPYPAANLYTASFQLVHSPYTRASKAGHMRAIF